MLFKIHIFLVLFFINFKIMDTFNLHSNRSTITFPSDFENYDDDDDDDDDEDEEEEAIRYRSVSKPNFVGTKGPLSFLDEMLVNYDKRAWPTYGTGKATAVTVNMHINSLSSINAANMDFNMDIYLRQSWVDPRLSLARFGITNVVTLNGQDIIENIWKPDLFFKNLKSGKFHKVTLPNKLIKLSPDGNVLFSMRLTLRLSCHMKFRHYPLDTQRCWVIIGTYAQTMDQVEISWQEEKPIIIEDDVEVPEFNMIPEIHGSFKRIIETGNFSFLNTSFIFERQNGYHLVQTYLPTFLIVMISWVSFWLNVDATPARVTLGVTTLLTLTTVASGVRTQLPPVSYVKAIDVWIGACSVMVFGALLEFTLVNYLSRRKVRPPQHGDPILKRITNNRQILFFSKGDLETEKKNDSATNQHECTEEEKRANVKRALTVDRICRVLFPATFLIFNLVYWIYYLYVPQEFQY